MTALYTERLHRRVNWPPGCWRPPDRGRPLCRRPHPPDAFRMGSWNTGPEHETITFHKLSYDRTLYRASSPTRQLAPRLLAPARPRTTPMPSDSSAGCLSHGFLEHRTRTRNNHFSQVDSMTALYTERLHRRVNWPPGCWRPPDRGRPLCRRPDPPDAFRMGSWNTGPEPETITFHKLIL